MVDWLTRWQELVNAYLASIRELEINRKPLDGAFGFGGGIASDPCQDHFAKDAETLFREMEAASPSSDEIRAVLTDVYQIPKEGTIHQSAWWMLQAVQGLTLPLIEYLSPEDAAALSVLYKQLYPRRKRLPAQNKVFAALQRKK